MGTGTSEILAPTLLQVPVTLYSPMAAMQPTSVRWGRRNKAGLEGTHLSRSATGVNDARPIKISRSGQRGCFDAPARGWRNLKRITELGNLVWAREGRTKVSGYAIIGRGGPCNAAYFIIGFVFGTGDGWVFDSADLPDYLFDVSDLGSERAGACKVLAKLPQLESLTLTGIERGDLQFVQDLDQLKTLRLIGKVASLQGLGKKVTDLTLPPRLWLAPRNIKQPVDAKRPTCARFGNTTSGPPPCMSGIDR